jgi:catechol 2,3-dioxygenase-like lactoylglutathione lyase family enzyme
MEIDFDRQIPVLRIYSLEHALDFYVRFLGCQIDWEHRNTESGPVYMQVSRESLALHLSGHHGDATPGSTVYVRMTGLDAFHAEIIARDYPAMRPAIEVAPWGERVMEVIDPFGNRIRFAEAMA